MLDLCVRIMFLLTGLALTCLDLTCLDLSGGPRGGYSVEQVKTPSNPLLYCAGLCSAGRPSRTGQCTLLTHPKSPGLGLLYASLLALKLLQHHYFVALLPYEGPFTCDAFYSQII